MNVETTSGSTEGGVATPEPPAREPRGRQQVDVHRTEPCSVQRLGSDEVKNFIVRGTRRHRKPVEEGENFASMKELSAGEFLDHQGMDEDGAL
jgi:hypothetical protein